MISEEFIYDAGPWPTDIAAHQYFIMGWDWRRACDLSHNMLYPFKERNNTVYRMTHDFRMFLEGQLAYVYARDNKKSVAFIP